jgi:hypothetical protein
MSFASSVKKEISNRTGDEPCCYIAQKEGFALFAGHEVDGQTRIKWEHLKRDCCKRAFVRGAFLGGGYIIEPEKSYHLEMLVTSAGLRNNFEELMQFFGIEAKWIRRSGAYVFYFKGSEQIVDILTIIGAHKSMMEFLNVKIEKEMRGDVNRIVNCETANVEKSISASLRQIRAIETIGIDNLPDSLRTIARMRLENRECSLKELGGLMMPPLTKSAVNHLMRKIMEIYERRAKK